MERFCVFARRPSLPLLRITANKKILNYGRNMGGSHIRHRTEQKIQNATKIGRNYSKSEWFPADFLRFVLYGREKNAPITERDRAFKTRQTSRLFGRFARLFASGEGVLTQHGRKKRADFALKRGKNRLDGTHRQRKGRGIGAASPVWARKNLKYT